MSGTAFGRNTWSTGRDGYPWETSLVSVVSCSHDVIRSSAFDELFV